MKGIMKAVELFLVLGLVFPFPSFGEEILEEPTGLLSLDRAISLALTKNPELEAFSLEIRVREARALQAGLLPNPDLDVEVEDAGGSGKFSGFQRTQTTIQLSQLIELGAKRARRARAASLTKELATWDYESKRVDVLTQVTQAFTDVLGAQQKLNLMRNLVALAERFRFTVSERVKAGKVSPIEGIKAKVALSSTLIELERAKRKLKVTRKILAAAWGSTIPRFKAVKGNLYSIAPIPSKEDLFQRIFDNPDLARWSTEIAQRQAVVDREKSKAIPSITLAGGYRRLEESNDNSIVFGISVPLMIFNRNQGSIQGSLHELSKAESNRRRAEILVTAALSEAYQALAVSHAEVISLKSQILPGAQQAFDSINEGYRVGKFGFLDVLDSQRTLFQAKAQFLDALTTYHKAVAGVERLAGGSLNTGLLNKGTK